MVSGKFVCHAGSLRALVFSPCSHRGRQRKSERSGTLWQVHHALGCGVDNRRVVSIKVEEKVQTFDACMNTRKKKRVV